MKSTALFALFGLVLLSAIAMVCVESSGSCSHISIPYKGRAISALNQCHACCNLNKFNDYRASHSGPGAICMCRKV